jgi:hypothetical protein
MPKKVKTSGSPIDEFIKRLQGSREYMVRFLVTLELNKIEAQYQAADKPMIFFKEIDNFGIVRSFTINPFYGQRIPQPKIEFTVEEVHAVGNSFNVERIKALGIMLLVGEIENVMSDPMIEKDGEKTLVPIFKEFDQDGFPTAYRLNMEVKVVEV